MMKKKMMLMLLIMLLLLLGGIVYAYQGWSMHNQVSGEEAKFHALLDDYYSQSKATRDSAPANSELTDQLVEIQQYPSTLLELKLVGIGRTLTGIFLSLVAILMALVMMPVRLGGIIMKKE